MLPSYILRSPVTGSEFSSYYKLRWEVLRKPWKQAPGSERDELDVTAYHLGLFSNTGEVVAAGRLQFNTNEEAQVRYMAVSTQHQGNGYGRMILQGLERYARDQGAQYVILQARENAVPFYERCGYTITEKTFLLYDVIQHYHMKKFLVQTG